jgi:murein DD-endopeptidase MepM/ murein hydrolase activator NlpD
VLFFVPLSLMTFLGTSNEGQAALLDNWVRHYVEETALVLENPRQSASTLADINSVFSGSGGDASLSPAPSTDAPAIQESAMLALSAPDEEYMDHVIGQRGGISNYTVQEGDLLSFIASDYGVSVETVVWANNLKDADSISPGMVLRIPPVSGVLHTVRSGETVASLATRYGSEAERIIAFNRLPQDGTLEAGDELMVPGGRMPNSILPTASTAVARAASSPAFSHLPDLNAYFMAPTTGFNWGRIHGRNGVDIANSYGTPILAAADGVVTVADSDTWNGGFGRYIKISHPNGTETLYAHASQLLVAVGQTVAKGQRIALMGSTGRSTGNHLHFEVHGARNPLAK